MCRLAQTILDNAIIGQPYISCERDRIVVEVVTERTFTGKIFVKGDYSNPTCSKIFKNGIPFQSNSKISEPFLGTVTRSKEPIESTFPIGEARISPPPEVENQNQNKSRWSSVGGASSGFSGAFGGSRGEEKLKIFGKPEFEDQGKAKTKAETLRSTSTCPPCEPCKCADDKRSRRATNSIRLEVPLDSCNSKRDRKLNPPSVVVSFVAIVSFHDSFITKLDKAYHIQCAYAEAEKIVSTDLDVGMLDDTDLSVTTDAPTCDYLITDEKGLAVKNGLVGELVNHKWTCGGGMSAKLKILVHDCFVKDGGGQQFQVIDENGCTLDQIMLQTPTYSDDGLTAQVNAYIFKFPDKSTVDFRCSITFCSIDDNECHTMTPPRCDPDQQFLRRKRSSTSKKPSVSLHANSLTVFDMDMMSSSSEPEVFPPESLLLSQNQIDIQPSDFCISVASFGILISASTFFATISFAIIFSYVFLRFNRKIYM
ncbi:unnamed protein product [Caenorhabditis angaria]|uniref:ZP domain-containing protein n=1 Tax=Caenorhabditis angaria TaxID=860376 RepID=A0A9P1I9V7_9PELO|nr:unnamed protein product [Caenorhabditis angaria]